jgi:hypothetical protein
MVTNHLINKEENEKISDPLKVPTSDVSFEQPDSTFYTLVTIKFDVLIYFYL